MEPEKVDDNTGSLMMQRLLEANGQGEPLSVSLRNWRRMSDGDKAQTVAAYRAIFGEEDPATVKAG